MESVFYGFETLNIDIMDYMDIKRQWIDEYCHEKKLTNEDDIDMEELVEWLAKKQVKNCSIPAVVGRSEQFNCFKKNIPNLAHRPCKNWCGDEVCHKPSN